MLYGALVVICFVLVIAYILLSAPLQSSWSNELVSKKEKQAADRARQHVVSNLNPSETKAKAGCEANVILIRHCEKQSLVDDSEWAHENCNAVGFRRAEYLATLFGDDASDRWPSPDCLFAQSPNRRHSRLLQQFETRAEALEFPPNRRHMKVLREVQTLGPLSTKFNIPIVSDYTNQNVDQLTESILGDLRKGKMCGKLVVICWDHSDMPDLAQKLGCGPFNGCPIQYNAMDYDSVWLINFSFQPHGKTDLSRKPESEAAVWQVFGTVVKQDYDPLRFQKHR